MPTKKEIEALKETVIEQLDKLNLIFISNDFKDVDLALLL